MTDDDSTSRVREPAQNETVETVAFIFLQDRQTIRNQGSYVLSQEQRNAKILIVDFEAYSTTGNDYYSYKTLPEHSHFGYATLFHGSSVQSKQQLNFARQRLYHSTRWDAIQLDQIHRWLDQLGDWLADFSSQVTGTALERLLYESEDIPSDPLRVVKVMGERNLQFDLIVYWVPFSNGIYGPTSTKQQPNDPTDGGDEYPQPETREPDDPFAGNPEESPAPPGADPRDYGQAKPGTSGYFDVAWYYSPIGTNDGKGWRQFNIELTNFTNWEVQGNGTKIGTLYLFSGSAFLTVELWNNTFYNATCPSVLVRKV